MVEITEEELQKNYDNYIEKCEQGESFLIVKKDGYHGSGVWFAANGR